jgi:hypothetical protein
MHPDIIQTIVAERTRSLREDAAASRRADKVRRSRRRRPLLRLTRAGSGLRPRTA